ncbi:UDP-N-acetylmuramate--alanine ligase [Gardnerella vaginalis 1500E]|uniref:UDP-N-acetylmuramate--L-alanine ligase n=1 Tax=Gardnerella vaginalis 1500E TaxID=698957 RepID=I4M2C6_GARVA|nr:UDP-N-acetylmuramate--L-alanine ligase [Gardnerella vaginalis]EIK83366.1 UDP-N-acetylmuramate--alanine ligase [Gardnerella vaginalis 1500E]
MSNVNNNADLLCSKITLNPIKAAFEDSKNASTLGRVHFIGIGGAGMSVLAEMLHEEGVSVSGCDREENDHTKRLEELGISVEIGQNASHVESADVLVYSSAIKPNNPEIVAAYANGVKLVHRSDILALLLASKTGVTVAGAHGKTTTSSLLSHILSVAGTGELSDPSYAIGGSIQAADGTVIDGGHAGKGSVMVAEADESDGSFEKYRPSIAIVTNAEADHLDHYGSSERYREAFVEHVSHAIDHVIICADDEGARKVLEKMSDETLRATIAYGAYDSWASTSARVQNLAQFAGIKHESEQAVSGREVFTLVLPGNIAGNIAGNAGKIEDSVSLEVSLLIPGLHNARNASAAIIAAVLLGMKPEDAARGAQSFRGASRRFDIRGCVNGVTVVDDYAHHPTEIEALLRAARRRYTSAKLRVLFQPHLFSRTRAFASEFANALALADDVIVTGIFPAREKQEDFPNIHAETIVEAAKSQNLNVQIEAVENMREAALKLAARAKFGDVLLTVGAGSITDMTSVMLEAL